MTMTYDAVKTLFAHLETGHSNQFFEHVSENVHWTVMGTHPLAGVYKTKQDFLSHTFQRLNKILQEGVILKVEYLIVQGNAAVVEMKSLSTAKNGKPFNNTYCWVVKFQEEMIVEVRAYVDSALVQQVIEENEKP